MRRNIPTAEEADELDRDKIEVTPEMIEAGEVALLQTLGGIETSSTWSFPGLATEVFLAMAAVGVTQRKLHPGS